LLSLVSEAGVNRQIIAMTSAASETRFSLGTSISRSPDETRNARRLLHKPIRNPVHQLVAGITLASDSYLREKLGERLNESQSLGDVHPP
jgi:hypothetical protein